MDSADFSQFVVTTANDTACETSPLKVRTLSPHLPATFTGTFGNFWDFSVSCHLIRISQPDMWFLSVRPRFAYSFLRIPPRDGHPCCSAMCFVVAYAHSGLPPVRARPWRANKKQDCSDAQSYLSIFVEFLIINSPGISSNFFSLSSPWILFPKRSTASRHI